MSRRVEALGAGPDRPATAELQRRREWMIEVCRTCGRHATWPFCEHRPEGYEPDPIKARWTEVVRVREVGRRGR